MITDFQVYLATRKNVEPPVFDHFLTKIRKAHPDRPIVQAMEEAAEQSEGWKTCKVCDDLMYRKTSLFLGCCSRVCYRDAYCQ